MSGSELASRVRDRFGVPVRSNIFRFLHLLRKGARVPNAITSKASEIKSHKAPRLAGTLGVAAETSGALAVSEEVLAGALPETSGVLALPEDVAAVTTAGVVAPAVDFADSLREVGNRFGSEASAVGVPAVSQGLLTAAAGEAASAAGVTVVSTGAAASTTGVTAVSASVLTVAAGEAAAAGVMAISATVVLGVATGLTTGAVAAASGVTIVSAGVPTVAVGAAAAAQCSEIMFSSVTATLLSAAAELATLVLCPMRVTS